MQVRRQVGRQVGRWQVGRQVGGKFVPADRLYNYFYESSSVCTESKNIPKTSVCKIMARLCCSNFGLQLGRIVYIAAYLATSYTLLHSYIATYIATSATLPYIYSYIIYIAISLPTYGLTKYARLIEPNVFPMVTRNYIQCTNVVAVTTDKLF